MKQVIISLGNELTIVTPGDDIFNIIIRLKADGFLYTKQRHVITFLSNLPAETPRPPPLKSATLTGEKII